MFNSCWGEVQTLNRKVIYRKEGEGEEGKIIWKRGREVVVVIKKKRKVEKGYIKIKKRERRERGKEAFRMYSTDYIIVKRKKEEERGEPVTQ